MMTNISSSLRNFLAILADLGVREGSELVAALYLGSHLGKIDSLKSLASGQRQLFGELLRSARRVTSYQLLDTLDEQRRSHKKMGEILVERGWLSAAECEVVLA